MGRRHQARCPGCAADRALILADKGSYEAARAEINRVLSAGRGGASAHYARAAVAFEEGRVDAAENDADPRSNWTPTSPQRRCPKGAYPGRAWQHVGRAHSLRQGAGRRLGFFRRPHHARRGEKSGCRRSADRSKISATATLPEVVLEKKGPIDCKVFLPATGSVVTAKCSE